MRGAECAPVSAKRARRKDVGVVEDESVRKRKEGEGTAREEEEGGEKVKVIRGRRRRRRLRAKNNQVETAVSEAGGGDERECRRSIRRTTE